MNYEENMPPCDRRKQMLISEEESLKVDKIVIDDATMAHFKVFYDMIPCDGSRTQTGMKIKMIKFVRFHLMAIGLPHDLRLCKEFVERYYNF